MNSLVTIESYDFMYQVQVAQLALEAEGIRSSLENETIVTMDWFLSNAVGGIKLQVAAEDAVAATRILNEIRANAKEREASLRLLKIIFRCPGCKRVVSMPAVSKGRVETCPKCGRYFDVPTESDPSLADYEADNQSVANRLVHAFSEHSKSYLKSYWITEFLLVLCIGCLPQLWSSTSIFLNYTSRGQAYEADVVAFLTGLLLGSPFVVFMIVFLMIMTRTTSATLGIRYQGVWKQMGLGVLVALGLVLLHEIILRSTGMTGMLNLAEWQSVESPLNRSFIATAAFCLISGSVAEELVMRGYLISRLEKHFGMRWWTVLLPALLFGSYHLYSGFYGFASATCVGLLYGYWFTKSRSLAGPIVASSLLNLAWFFTLWYGVVSKA